MIEQAKRGLARGHIQRFLKEMGRLGYAREEILDLLRQEAMKEGDGNADIGM